ncbi:hypothetical protein EDD53_2006 [Pacificibacter maritimus]|uniref:Transferrin-binding protein B C-lobe/N-lobe beta barrel domain-containing protein n=1 Tax=Pacificibacter maritimus TaxID=762213 RepID=A0A3N4U6A8_9RHOB|nr:hypothetical protein [Pacificibacter maritimus]RPE66306.1 hypothetical protein EDD53_2006 [Pacificibacter maritimus]
MNASLLTSLTLLSVVLSACTMVPAEEAIDESAFDQVKYNRYVDARNDAISVDARVTAADRLSATPTDETATLNGAYAISTYNGTESGPTPDLTGEMRMDVDFGAGTVSGTLHNSYTDYDYSGETHVNELDGSVGFSGSIDMDPEGGFYDSLNSTQWQIEADGAGTFVDSPPNSDEAITYRLDFDINGDFFDSSSVGTVNGVGEVGDLASGGMIEGNLDVTSDNDSLIYDITSGEYFVYELAD